MVIFIRGGKEGLEAVALGDGVLDGVEIGLLRGQTTAFASEMLVQTFVIPLFKP